MLHSIILLPSSSHGPVTDMKPLLRLLLLAILCVILYNIVAKFFRQDVIDEQNIQMESSIQGAMRANRVVKAEDKVLKEAPLEPIREPIKFENKREVLIYSATKFFNMDVTTDRFLGQCFSTKGFCRISENPQDYEKSDVVLFHNADYRGMHLPGARRLDRPHVLWSLESQTNDRFRPEPNAINWTMTPLKHSDIWYPYGHCEQRPERVAVNLDSIWQMKTAKTAVWLASNCHTLNRRKDIIDRLVSNGVDADLFGRCGKPAPGCDGVQKQGYDCVRTLIQQYKFYFSIENSNCKDYITEKFWATMGERYAVPIVLERKKYEAVGAPPNSFVAIDDFKSIKEAAEHIKKVGDSREEYLKYHEWRNTHQVFPEHDDGTGFCELCRVLQSPPYKFNTYPDISKFQSPHEQCNQDYGSRFL